jgi:hypothetical protein
MQMSSSYFSSYCITGDILELHSLYCADLFLVALSEFSKVMMKEENVYDLFNFPPIEVITDPCKSTRQIDLKFGIP